MKKLLAIIVGLVVVAKALFATTVSRADPTDEVVKELAGPVTSGALFVPFKIWKIALDALAAANDIVYVQNPTGEDLVIIHAIIRVSTAGGTATAVIDVDIINAATGTGDDIFDGVDANAAAVISSFAAGAGTNAEHTAWLWEKAGGTNDYVTAKLLVEAAANLVGDLFLVTIPAA